MAANTPTRRAFGIGLALALVGLTVGTVAAGFVNGSEIAACVKSDGTMRLIDPAEQTCKPNNETLVTWNVVGPTGPPGPTGAPGPTGPPGSGSGGGGATIAALDLFPGGGGLAGACTEVTNYTTIGVGCPGNTWAFPGAEHFTSFRLDPADYPAGSVLEVEWLLQASVGQTMCARLYDLAADAEVVNSEACVTNSGTQTENFLLTAAPEGFSAAGLYAIQLSRVGGDWMGGGALAKAILTIDWE